MADTTITIEQVGASATATLRAFPQYGRTFAEMAPATARREIRTKLGLIARAGDAVFARRVTPSLGGVPWVEVYSARTTHVSTVQPSYVEGV